MHDLSIKQKLRVSAYFSLHSPGGKYRKSSANDFSIKLEKFGYRPDILIHIADVITTETFTKFAPSSEHPYNERLNISYEEIYRCASESGRTEEIIGIPHSMIERSRLNVSPMDITMLYYRGYIGRHRFSYSMENIFVRKNVMSSTQFKPLNNVIPDRVPLNHWMEQAVKILDKCGWASENIAGLSVLDFEPYKGKKMSSRDLGGVIKRLRKRLKSKK